MVKIIIEVEENGGDLKTRVGGAIEGDPTAMEAVTAALLKTKIGAICEQGIGELLCDTGNMVKLADAIRSIRQKCGASAAGATEEAAPAEATPPAGATAASETVNG